MRTRSPDKRSRQKLKQGIQNVNPEAALEYFQISVNILEARKLTWASSQFVNSYVVVKLEKEKYRTGIKKNMDDPCYREFFLFEWYATIQQVQCTNLWFAVMEPRCCSSPRLLGESSIELGAIWAQPNHRVLNKWAQLSLPSETQNGVVGFLKLDISIICRGDVVVMPAVHTRLEGNKTSATFPSVRIGTEQQTANYLITIYGAFDLFAGLQNHGDRHSAKPPSTYVKVTFCGLSEKTAVQFRNTNPVYCEQVSIVEAFPNICQLIRLDVCSVESTFNKVLGSAHIRLEQISHDGGNGFVPTFGPSLLHMYGYPASSVEDGPYYKGALLVALRTVIPYYQRGLRSTCVEPAVPVLMDDLWTWEDFSILCTIFEVSMLDKKIIGKQGGVALTVSDVPCLNKNCSGEFNTLISEIKTKKLYYTKSMFVHNSSPDCGYLDLTEAFPVLQIAARLPDFRLKIFLNNMLRVIAADLEQALANIRIKLKNNETVILSHLVKELRKVVDDAAESMRSFLEMVDFCDQNLEDFRHFTDLDHKQLSLQREEIGNIFHQITRKVRDNSTMNMMTLVYETDSSTVTKKEMKSLLAETNCISLKIKNLVFTSSEGWPDLVIWLLNGVSRVAYCKVPLSEAIYSDINKQSGKFHDCIRTIYLKPLNCVKHFNTLQNNCTCISGKIELLTWMGLFSQRSMFDKVLPYAYKLVKHGFELSVTAPLMILICRIFIHRAKLNISSESSRLPCPFVRANTLNTVKETKIEQSTVTPVWNVILKMKCMISISQRRLKSYTPTILVEVFDSDIVENKLLGRVEMHPSVEDRASYLHAPKLQWHDIYNDNETCGQILMSAQFLEIPETLMKSTNYVLGDASTDEINNEDFFYKYMAPEILPACLMPKPNTYKIDIYWWGLRGVHGTKKPCAILEIEDLFIKSEIICGRNLNSNFPNGRTSHLFETPLNEAYCPPLMIQLCDSSTFGRTLFLGTKVEKNPNKFMVDWLPSYAREATLKSVSVISANFEKVNENYYIKRNTSLSNNAAEKNEGASHPIPRKRSLLEILFCGKQNDEEELLPVFSKLTECVALPLTKNSVHTAHDWWKRFFASLKGRKSNSNGLRNIKIYQSELENQPQFDNFKDWCKTFILYSGRKTGNQENDQKLHSGSMKAGIAIYKWPPPFDTEAVNYNGVNLAQGFFDDHPVNHPMKFLLRVYIIRGINITARSFSSYSNPYIVIDCGNKHSEDEDRFMTNSPNPVFGKLYEFYCCLPEDYLLTVSLYDHLAVSPNNLIGSTTVDLEDRIYTKHKARVGLASEYEVTGPAKWRDCVKPSAILEDVCLKNHLPLPAFHDGTVTFNGVYYKETCEKNKTYLSASECKENICLEILHKWQTLPLFGYQIVPEHVETRKLINPDIPGVHQGKIQMWIDLFPISNGTYIPLPVHITPRKVEEYELRVIIWSVQGIHETPSEHKRIDMYVKAWIGSEEQTQYTDIHYQSTCGDGHFNWRMIFHFQYQHAEKSVILKEKGPFTEEEEHLPPELMLYVIDSDADSCTEYLGSLLLDLNTIPKGVKQVTECKLCLLDTVDRVDLFSIRSLRGWWPLKSVDINNGNIKLSGVMDLEMSLLPKETALLMPVGVGRDFPMPLPEPIRVVEVKNESRSSLESICGRKSMVVLVIGVLLGGLYFAFICNFPFSLFGLEFDLTPDFM